MELSDWDLKDVEAFVEVVTTENTKKLLRDTADSIAFKCQDMAVFRSTLTCIYADGFIEGLIMLHQMFLQNQLLAIARTENPAELINLVKSFADRQRSGSESDSTH